MDTLKNPHSLGSIPEQQCRLERLKQPHVEPLSQYLRSMGVERPDKIIPFFDPSDGGIRAKALFLMQAVGPRRMGSPFLSVDNTDATAGNLRELLRNAEIGRGDTLFWNLIPWYVGAHSQGEREIKEQDIAQGLEYLKALFALLPDLKVVGLLGQKVHLHSDAIQRMSNLPTVKTAHPGPQAFNGRSQIKEQAQASFMEIARYIHH